MTDDHRDMSLPLSDPDRLIHEPARYNIMALLYVIDTADFLFVQNQTLLTPGNLSAHLSKLEKAGYVKVNKEFVGKKPKTFLILSSQGRAAFEKYRKKMQEIITIPLTDVREVKNDNDGNQKSEN
ncbi:winged helix-turn-helix domain-containing protein [Candidatus Zixiibacteriota bacterium]